MVTSLVPGLKVMPLHEYNSEHVALVKWEPNTIFNAHKHWGWRRDTSN